MLSYQRLVVSLQALKSAWSVCSGVCSTLTSSGFADDLFVAKRLVCSKTPFSTANNNAKRHLAEQTTMLSPYLASPPPAPYDMCRISKNMTRGPSLPRCTRAGRDQYWMDLGSAKCPFMKSSSSSILTIRSAFHVTWHLMCYAPLRGSRVIWCY